MNRKRDWKTNYVFNSAYEIINIIVPLVTTPYISRVLGAENIGVFSYANSIVVYFTMFINLGIGPYASKTFAVIGNDKEERTRRFWDLFVLRTVLAFNAILTYVVYAFLFSDHKIIALLQGLYLLGAWIDISWFFRGCEEFVVIATRNFIVKIVNVLIIFCFVKDEGDLWIYTLALSGMTVISGISIWFYLPRYIIRIKHTLLPFLDILQIISLAIPACTNQIYEMLDKTMIGIWTATYEENGYYEQAGKVIRMSIMLISSYSAVMLPRLARIYSDGKSNEITKQIDQSYRFLWFLAFPMMMGIIVISSVFVPVFFGNGYDKVEKLLIILSFLYILMGLKYVAGGEIMIATKRQKVYNTSLVIGGIVNIFLNFLLIPHFFSVGAAIGSVFGEVVTVVYIFVWIRKDHLYSLRRVIMLSRNYVIASTVMFAALTMIKPLVRVSGVGLVELVIVGILVYGTMLIVLHDEICASGLKKLKKKFF